MKALAVGDKLWFVHRERRHSSGQEVTVVNVGRKWAKLSNRERIDMETLVADGSGYTSPGQAYLSEADYAAKVSRDRAFDSFRRKVEAFGYYQRMSITEDQVRRAAAILGIDLDKP